MGNVPSVNLNSEYFNQVVPDPASEDEKKAGLRNSLRYLTEVSTKMEEMTCQDFSQLVDYQTWNNISNHKWISHQISLPIDSSLKGSQLVRQLGNLAFMSLNCSDLYLRNLALERYNQLVEVQLS